MTGLPLRVCAACGHAVFPARALCPACGGRVWEVEETQDGVVEQVTTHRRGGTIASVRTARGPVVIARAPSGTIPGANVSLSLSDGVPAASP